MIKSFPLITKLCNLNAHQLNPVHIDSHGWENDKPRPQALMGREFKEFNSHEVMDGKPIPCVLAI